MRWRRLAAWVVKAIPVVDYELTHVGKAKDGTTVIRATPRPELAERLTAQREFASSTGQIEIDVYLNTEDERVARGVFRAVDALVRAAGYANPLEIEVRRGSFFRRARAVIVDAARSDEVTERLKKIERSIELEYLSKRQAQVTLDLSVAVQRVVVSLESVPEACVRIGAILFVKWTGQKGAVVVIRDLSPMEVSVFERMPEIQMRPRFVLEALAVAISALEPASVAQHTGGEPMSA